MYYKKFERKFKVISVLISFSLAFNPWLVPVVYAEELTETETQQSTPVVEVETVDESDTTQTGGDSEINTGDAESTAEIETTANENVTEVPGEVEESEDVCQPPETQVDCPEETCLGSENTAEVENEGDSVSETGTNVIEGAEDAQITTGDATASADLTTNANTNVTLIDNTITRTSTPTVTPEPVEDSQTNISTPTPTAVIKIGSTSAPLPTVTTTPTEVDEEATSSSDLAGQTAPAQLYGPVLINENDGKVDNEVEVKADSGENQANENSGDVTIDTGEADAAANLLNLLNTNIVGSDFAFYFVGDMDLSGSDIDLNKLWKELSANVDPSGLEIKNKEELSSLQVINDNQAVLTNLVLVTSNTGSNQADENFGDVEINSGNASSLANVINFVNLNINGSKFIIPVINILDDFQGDIILPSKEKFSLTEEQVGQLPEDFLFINENQAEIDNELTASANTGENETQNVEKDSEVNTGDAQSQANTLSFVNQNILYNNWFKLLISNLGNWTGKIYGWSSPEAVEDLSDLGLISLEKNNLPNGGGDNKNKDNSSPDRIFANSNQAKVNNKIDIQANTGQNKINQAGGNAEIKTGSAKALGNLLNFVNINIWGSRWFFGLINILGNWNGNLIFAYPDVTVGISGFSDRVQVGQNGGFIVNFKNQGYETARDVWINLELPKGFSYLSDSSGLLFSNGGRTCRWQVGSLNPGEGGTFEVAFTVDNDFEFSQPISLFQKIFKPALAAEKEVEVEISTRASIGTLDLESNSNNNAAVTITNVYATVEDTSDADQTETIDDQEYLFQGIDQRQPELEVTAKNFVNNFVYLGDTVTFEISVKNVSDVVSYDTFISHALYDGLPEDLGVAEFYYGDLYPNQRATLSFGMYLAGDGSFDAGDYRTITQAFGYAPNGNEVSSNSVQTDFAVKLKDILFSAQAVTKREEEVLGETTAECPQVKNDLLPYVVLFILSAFGVIDKTRKLLALKKLDEE